MDAKEIESERYLIRKRQKIVIIVEELHSHRIILRRRVTGAASTITRISIPELPFCERWLLSSSHIAMTDRAHTSFPTEMSDSVVIRGIARSDGKSEFPNYAAAYPFIWCPNLLGPWSRGTFHLELTEQHGP